ncbi:MAG: hypothetical protein ABIG93_01860 [archaeon]|nr:hypothetical protein [Nanoarchaeota archaeon]
MVKEDREELSEETKKLLKQAEQDVKEGRIITMKELKEELGIISKTNILLMAAKESILELSCSLGYESTLFSEEFFLIKAKDKKKILKEIKSARKKSLFVVAEASSEELLRFLVEKTSVDMVIGMEKINPRDSVHYPRGAVDQVIAKIARERGKILGFSFNSILNSEDKFERAKLMNRIRFNLKLCKKYKVKTYFGNFAQQTSEMRSSKDLKSFWLVLGGNGLNSVEL